MQLLGKQHGWAGHVVRMGQEHLASQWSREGTSEQWHLAQAVHASLGGSVEGTWRHKKTGWKRNWESVLVAAFGDLWRNRAIDRKSWRQCKRFFQWQACNILIGGGHRAFGTHITEDVPLHRTEQSMMTESPVAHIEGSLSITSAWRMACREGLKRMAQGILMQVVGDSQVVADIFNGKAVASNAVICKHVSTAQESMRQLLMRFPIRPRWAHDFVKQVARSDNSAADSAANRALDQGSFEEFASKACSRFVQELAARPDREYGFLWSFDGASRGNPGPASFGVCAWWGVWTCEGFRPGSLIYSRGATIGSCGNNQAEAHGLSHALRGAMKICTWMLQQAARATHERD